MTPTGLRSAAIALGLVGAVSQLGVALMGDAIGGPSAIVFIVVVDAFAALVGVALLWRRTSAGLVLIGAAGLGALVAMFWSTLLEVGVATFLVGAATAAGLSLRAPAIARNQG